MQILKPIATVAVTGWTVFGAGSAHAALAEGSAEHDGDATFLFATTVGAKFEVGIQAGSAPGCRHGHSINIAARRNGAGAEPVLAARLKHGGNVISERQFTTPQAEAWWGYESFLTPANAGAIPSYSSGLTIEIEVLSIAGGTQVRVSAADFNVPSPGSIDPQTSDIAYGAGLHYKQRFKAWWSDHPRYSFPGGLRPCIVETPNSGLATSPIRRVIEPSDGLFQMLYEDGFVIVGGSLAHVGMSTVDPNQSLFTPPTDLALWRPMDATPGSKWLTTPFSYKDVLDLFAMVRRQSILSSGALQGLVNPRFTGGMSRSGGAHVLSISALLRDLSGLFGITSGGSTRPDFAICFQEAAWWFPAWKDNIAPFFPRNGDDYSAPNVTMDEVPVNMLRAASPADLLNEAAYPGTRTLNKTAKHFLYAASGPIEEPDYDDGSETEYTGGYKQKFMTIAHAWWNGAAHAEALRELNPANKGKSGFRTTYVTGSEAAGFNEDEVIDLVDGSASDPLMRRARAWALLGALSAAA